jgi:(p)ppGpp synthase/HD superfamily hydrolase
VRQVVTETLSIQQAFNEALAFALDAHREQTRKGTSVPYITHVVAVAEMLAYYYPENAPLVVAGLLHDVVEDTEIRLEDIRAKFGDRVAILVAAVTKPSDAPDLPVDKIERWRRQRLDMLSHLDPNDKDTLRLKAADSLANLKTIERDLHHPEVGEAVWSRFKVGREQSLWYYNEVLARVREGIGGESLCLELEDVLASLNG